MPSETSLVFLQHRGSLIAYATNIVGSQSRAEDLVQEAWVRLEEAARQRLVGEPLSHLYKIIRNLAMDEHRDGAREKSLASFAVDNGATVLGGVSHTPETIALYREQVRVLDKAMVELPERTRLAVEMHRLGGMKLREIALALGVSLPTAHRLVVDGLEHCRQRVGWW